MSMRDFGEKTPHIMYGPVDGSYAVYAKVCPKCGRFVKADEKSKIPEYLGQQPNATCKKCGRVQMPFWFWYTEEDE